MRELKRNFTTMKCPRCVEQGKKSTVYPDGFGTSTAMYCQPYYDEDGTYHFHDLNSHTSGASCSQGHRWMKSSGNKCPAKDCGFGGDDTVVFLEDTKPVEVSTIDISGDQTTTVSDTTNTITGDVCGTIGEDYALGQE